jgi:hypothetical protein
MTELLKKEVKFR